jgi:oligopeptide/dipeptide ABC transporter ATP-binding protein
MSVTAPAVPVLQVESLSISFPHPQHQGWVPLVQGVDFSIAAGEIMGLVGESGCGKSLTSLAILGLLPRPGLMTSGTISLNGLSLQSLDAESYRRLRGNAMALIPQDPLSALNPVYTIGNQLEEILITHTPLNKAQRHQRMRELLDAVRISNPEQRLKAYPHEFSGGMRQRVLIAMALACTPKLLIADEPTTALDVTVQADILSLIQELCHEFNMATLLITHDMGVVAEVCHKVAVMYAGHLVETALVEDLFASPRHPYTIGLLQSIPRPNVKQLHSIEGTPPSIVSLPEEGCRFRERCPEADAVLCAHAEALVLKDASPTHQYRCVKA